MKEMSGIGGWDQSVMCRSPYRLIVTSDCELTLPGAKKGEKPKGKKDLDKN